MPYGLIGIQQVILNILFYVAEQLLAAVENDAGGLLVIEYAQYNAQQ